MTKPKFRLEEIEGGKEIAIVVSVHNFISHKHEEEETFLGRDRVCSNYCSHDPDCTPDCKCHENCQCDNYEPPPEPCVGHCESHTKGHICGRNPVEEHRVIFNQRYCPCVGQS